MRSKIVSLLLVAGLALSGSTAGVIAHHKSGHNKGGDSAKSQYRPGKGCGDKNHRHEREDECKKPPK